MDSAPPGPWSQRAIDTAPTNVLGESVPRPRRSSASGRGLRQGQEGLSAGGHRAFPRAPEPPRQAVERPHDPSASSTRSPSASRVGPACSQIRSLNASVGGSYRHSGIGIEASGGGSPSAALAARVPKTKHSLSEFEASRFAPCRPATGRLADRVETRGGSIDHRDRKPLRRPDRAATRRAYAGRTRAHRSRGPSGRPHMRARRPAHWRSGEPRGGRPSDARRSLCRPPYDHGRQNGSR